MIWLTRSLSLSLLVVILSSCYTADYSLPPIYSVAETKLTTSLDQPNSEKAKIEATEDNNQNLVVPKIALALEPLDISGEWKVTSGTFSCRLVTPQTAIKGGYHALTFNCPEPFSQIKLWNLNENTLYLLDKNNAKIAQFYAVKKDFLHGMLESGEKVNLTR